MQRSRVKYFVLIGLSLSIVINQTQAQNAEQYVYRVTISASPFTHASVIQTGFLLKGIRGIVTALHGVAGGKEIHAQNSAGNRLDALRIEKVDVDNDLALLVSESMPKSNSNGFESGQSKNVRPGEELRVPGFPEAIEYYVKRVEAGSQVLKKLSALIPPNDAKTFHMRKSPDAAHISIMSIDGDLGPGFSGAPVLNLNNQVVGVVDGGLIDVSICWAIPITSITWADAKSQASRIEAISEMDPRKLFAIKVENDLLNYRNWRFGFSTMVTRNSLRDFNLHMGIDCPLSESAIDYYLGLEIGFIRKTFAVRYATLPGFSTITTEDADNALFISLSLNVVPFKWEYFEPSIGLVVGLPVNVQGVMRTRVLKIMNVGIHIEGRATYYKYESYNISFNRYSSADRQNISEYIMRLSLGLFLSFDQ